MKISVSDWVNTPDLATVDSMRAQKEAASLPLTARGAASLAGAEELGAAGGAAGVFLI